MNRVVTGNAGKTEQTMEVDVRLAFFAPYMGQDEQTGKVDVRLAFFYTLQYCEGK